MMGVAIAEKPEGGFEPPTSGLWALFKPKSQLFVTQAFNHKSL